MRRRYASVITATASSDSLKNRPAAARAPTMSKYSGETVSVTASETPERVSTRESPPPEYSASCENERCDARYASTVPA
jgi:hypothetical protein